MPLLDAAGRAVRYRVVRELLPPEVGAGLTDAVWLSQREGIRLALAQRVDGIWNHLMLGVPKAGARDAAGQVGTVMAVHRLLELGWDQAAPPFLAARRPLFRLLAEDTDHAFTYEFAGMGRDADTVQFSRGMLRAGAASALAHAGYEMDPRLRGAAMRLLERVDEFLGSDLADDPWVKQGGEVALHPDAFPPSFHFLVMLSFMPTFLNEHDDFLDRLATWLQRPLPKHAARQWIGVRPLEHPALLLGDPLAARGAVDADVPFAAFWLELAARSGLLGRHPGWMQAWERLLNGRDRDLIWRPSRGQGLVNQVPMAWPFVDLGGDGEAGVPGEVTFRLALIARHLERGPEFT